jgi:hypothetical protein
MNDLLIKEKFTQCEICAYHESGHVLFAYLCGYTCKEVQLIDEGNVNGFTSYAVIDYGRDAYLASRFTTADNAIDFFKCLALGERLEAVEVGRRLARIFLGGSVAAAVFNNQGNAQIPLPVQVDYMDLIRVEFIHYVIQELSIDKEENFIEYGLQDALYTVSNVNIWHTISDLALKLLAANRLDKNDIEECLEEHGITSDRGSSKDAIINQTRAR